MRINQDHAPGLLHVGLKKLFTTRASVRMRPFSVPRLVLLCGFTPTLNLDGVTDLGKAFDLGLNQFTCKGISLGVSPPLTYLWPTNAGITLLIGGGNDTDQGWRQRATQLERNGREQKYSSRYLLHDCALRRSTATTWT